MDRKLLTILVAVLIFLIVVSGLVWYLVLRGPIWNAQQTSSQKEVPTGKAEFKEFLMTGENYKFSPDQIVVNRGDKVRVTFKSIKGTHDFIIDEFNVSTKQLSDGKMETLEFSADKSGKFDFYCSVGNHRGLGMKGTLVVN